MIHKRAFYTPRPSLAELYDETPTLFAAVTLPEGVELSTFRDLALAQFGELDTIMETGAALAAYLGVWSAANLSAWERIAQTLANDYDPLHNYDRTEEETEALRSSGGSQFAGRTHQGGSTVDTVERQGYDSTDYVPADKMTSAPNVTNDSNSSTQSIGKEDRTRSVRAYGNIGVTTSQQMAEAEISLRNRWTIYGAILEAFRRDVVVGVW